MTKNTKFSTTVAADTATNLSTLTPDSIFYENVFFGKYTDITTGHLSNRIGIRALDTQRQTEIITCNTRNIESFSVKNKDCSVHAARAGGVTAIRVAVDEKKVASKNEFGISRPAYAGYRAYEALFQFVEQHNLKQLLRIWNYIPNILAAPDASLPQLDRELYRQFNIGRQAAWAKHGPKDSNGNLLLPAATGIGSLHGPLVLTALCSEYAMQHLENPRQTPTLEYPTRFGTKPPAFARGTLHLPPWGEELFVSGTGSIVGAETVHLDNPIEQLHETIQNIKTLIGSDNLKNYGYEGFTLDDLTSIRVYIRQPEHYEMLRKEVESILGTSRPILYLNNQFCRPDLFLEMEAIARKK